MMNNRSLFHKNDFKICNVPVPDGYPQSQTHAGIAYVQEKLGGYSYWLTSSPFPNKKTSKLILMLKIVLKRYLFQNDIKRTNYTNTNIKRKGEDFENPMLYFANEDESGMCPVNFIPFENNPLMDKPDDIYGGGTYCSDPDIFIENSNIYILNRETYRRYYYPETNTYGPFLRINFIVGSLVNNKFVIKSIDSKFTDNDLACSPCFLKYKEKYRYMYLVTNSYNDGLICEKMVVRSDNTIEGKFEDKKNINIEGGKYIPWHFSVFNYKEKLFAIVACVIKGKKGRCYQMLGEFDDSLDNLFIYQTPLTDLKSYRGAAFVREDGVFVLYSTTVHEKIKDSKSVDGRDIIMAYKPFNTLLKEIKQNNK
jgi:hypothetical protein